MKSKSQKIREYFIKNPFAAPKVVGARFKVAMPMVYKIRRESMHEAQEEISKELLGVQVPISVSPTANQRQVGGSHYKEMGVQPWDVVDTWSREQRIGYYRGGALKYIMRMGAKDESPMEVAKGKHYMEKLLEVLNDV